MEIPSALGAPTALPSWRHEGTAAGRSPPRTQTMDQGRRCSLSEVVRERIRLAQLRYGPLSNER